MKTLIIVIVVVAVLLLIALALAVRIVKQYERGCCSGWAGCGARGHRVPADHPGRRRAA